MTVLVAASVCLLRALRFAVLERWNSPALDVVHCQFNQYAELLKGTAPDSSASHGNHPPFIAANVAYVFDLKGPTMMVATGCSSSLLSVHLAKQALLLGDCDMAIAGGITLDLLPFRTVDDIWTQLGITGTGVKCRPFDDGACGIAKGEGTSVVLLKRLDDAIADGDHMYVDWCCNAASIDHALTPPPATAFFEQPL